MRQWKTLIEGTWLNNVAYIFVVRRAKAWLNNVTAPILPILTTYGPNGTTNDKSPKLHLVTSSNRNLGSEVTAVYIHFNLVESGTVEKVSS